MHPAQSIGRPLGEVCNGSNSGIRLGRGYPKGLHDRCYGCRGELPLVGHDAVLLPGDRDTLRDLSHRLLDDGVEFLDDEDLLVARDLGCKPFLVYRVCPDLDEGDIRREDFLDIGSCNPARNDSQGPLMTAVLYPLSTRAFLIAGCFSFSFGWRARVWAGMTTYWRGSLWNSPFRVLLARSPVTVSPFEWQTRVVGLRMTGSENCSERANASLAMSCASWIVEGSRQGSLEKRA